MGVSVSHGCLENITYGAFNRFKEVVCEAACGGSFASVHSAEFCARYQATHNEMPVDGMWYWGEGLGKETHPGLYALLSGSDCEGVIEPKEAGMLADELEALLPVIAEMGSGHGQIASRGGYIRIAQDFVAGCRKASCDGENIEIE